VRAFHCVAILWNRVRNEQATHLQPCIQNWPFYCYSYILHSLSHAFILFCTIIPFCVDHHSIDIIQPPGSDYAQFIDIEAAMYRDRTMMINRFIDDAAANSIIAIILYLRNESPKDKISLYFNVPGGMLRPSLAIYDLIQNTKKNCQIETVNLALCAGMGAVLCAAGTKGMRSAMPNARFLLQRTGMNQPFRGQATDIALEVKNLKNWNDRMQTELSELTGQTPEQIAEDLKRDFYLEADAAVRYGLIDQVLLPSPRKRAARGSEADLGAFEGDEEQRYQGENKGSGGGGWGSQQQQQPPPDRRGNKKDDDEPEIAKG